MENFNFNIDNKDFIDMRIDIFLSEQLELTRSRIQGLIKEDNVFLFDKPINKNYKLKYLDEILVTINPPKQIDIIPENIPINILYEDNDIIVVDKDKGMVVHPSNGHYTGTLVNALMHHCKNLSGINGVIRPGIVHRIDKDTSGILVIAKNDNAHNILATQLKDHSMYRIYNALVFNNIKDDNGTIDAPIGRHNIDRKKMTVTQKNSKHAVTHYEVLERYNKLGKSFTKLKLQLETGRTHQIRVHMAYIKHPLLGDSMYGVSKKNQPFGLAKSKIEQLLHAKTLGFIHPVSNKYMEFNSPLPKHFLNIENKLN